MSNPNPTALRPSARAQALRNLHCPNYMSCLSLAAKRGWSDWSCRQCDLGGEPTEGTRATDFANDRKER